MTINLTPEQIAWLEKQVAGGSFASLDEAAQFYIGDAIAHAGEINLDDLDWAKPLIEEARAEIARGEGIPLADFKAHLRKRAGELDR